MIETKPAYGMRLNGNTLKLIAMLSMLIDHVGVFLFPSILVFRMIGRIAFPIFAYMIAEGCRHTRNRTRYLAGIAGLGTVCQIVMTVMTNSHHMGILLTFSLAILVIYATDAFLAEQTLVRAIGMTLVIGGAVFFSTVMPLIPRFHGFKMDYDVFGILLPVLLYYANGRRPKLISATALLLIYALLTNYVQFFALFAIPLLFLYDGTRGRARLKYLFYVFYPLHLAVIYLIKFLISAF